MRRSASPEFFQISLQTSRLLLREFMESDAEAIQGYAGDPEETRYTSGEPNTPEVWA